MTKQPPLLSIIIRNSRLQWFGHLQRSESLSNSTTGHQSMGKVNEVALGQVQVQSIWTFVTSQAAEAEMHDQACVLHLKGQCTKATFSLVTHTLWGNCKYNSLQGTKRLRQSPLLPPSSIRPGWCWLMMILITTYVQGSISQRELGLGLRRTSPNLGPVLGDIKNI